MLQPQQQIQPQLYSVPAPGDGQQPFSFQMQAASQQQPLSLPVIAQQQTWDPNSHGPSSLDANSSRGEFVFPSMISLEIEEGGGGKLLSKSINKSYWSVEEP